MNSLEDNWLNQVNHSAKPSMVAFYEDFQKINSSRNTSVPALSRLPRPEDNFEPFLEGYIEVDDVLTQTLNSLQELDIPVGDESRSAHLSQKSYSKGHSKKPSGTAIFGFAQHNKTLSIPGASINPNELFNKKVQSTSPKLFETVQDLKTKVSNKEEDFIIPSEEPTKFKFPNFSSSTPSPDNSSGSKRDVHPTHSQKTVPVSYKYLQKLRKMLQDEGKELELEALLDGDMTGFEEPSIFNEESQNADVGFMKSSKDSLPPTSSIGLGLQYEESSPSHSHASPASQVFSPPPQHVPQAIPEYQLPPPPPPMYAQPPLPQYEVQQSYMPYQQPVYTYSSQQISPYHQQVIQPQQPNVALQQHLQLQNMVILPQELQPQQLQTVQVPQSQVKMHMQPQQIRAEPHNLQQLDSSESEFSDVPKTPSPTLRSQARFVTPYTEPRQSAPWTPAPSGTERRPYSEARKPYDKVSTLPPGEIDLYVIGPRADKSYMCNYGNCGKVFTRRYNVRSHVQTHLSDRPFICDYESCGKSFVRQHDLTRHKKIHSDASHKCPCGKNFSRLDALFRHRQRNICAGGLGKNAAKYHFPTGNTPSGSITKPKKEGTMIKMDNDNVAKKLEFDITNNSTGSKHKSTFSNSPPIIEEDFTHFEEDNVFCESNI